VVAALDPDEGHSSSFLLEHLGESLSLFDRHHGVVFRVREKGSGFIAILSLAGFLALLALGLELRKKRSRLKTPYGADF
jgi:hypothetical protein